MQSRFSLILLLLPLWLQAQLAPGTAHYGLQPWYYHPAVSASDSSWYVAVMAGRSSYSDIESYAYEKIEDVQSKLQAVVQHNLNSSVHLRLEAENWGGVGRLVWEDASQPDHVNKMWATRLAVAGGYTFRLSERARLATGLRAGWNRETVQNERYYDLTDLLILRSDIISDAYHVYLFPPDNGIRNQAFADAGVHFRWCGLHVDATVCDLQGWVRHADSLRLLAGVPGLMFGIRQHIRLGQIYLSLGGQARARLIPEEVPTTYFYIPRNTDPTGCLYLSASYRQRMGLGVGLFYEGSYAYGQPEWGQIWATYALPKNGWQFQGIGSLHPTSYSSSGFGLQLGLARAF